MSDTPSLGVNTVADAEVSEKQRAKARRLSFGKESVLLVERPKSLQLKQRPIDRVDEHQSALWWFMSVTFPLIAGTFGPIADLFAICSLQSWIISKPTGARIADPGWLLTLNIISIVSALLANFFLLFNFARRIPYTLAQPLSITLWYLSSIFLLIPVIITRTTLLDRHLSPALSESYYYAFIATILYFIISTLLLFNLLGSYVFHAYPPSFRQLSAPQRTLMLQTIIFSAYLAIGAGIFSSIENWNFVDGLYWADYTLLTIGLGSDFPVEHTAGRMILIPYAAIGILIVGLIVNSVRGLVIERARARIVKGRLEMGRRKWKDVVECLRDRGKSGGDEARKELRKFLKSKGRIVNVEESEQRKWRRKEFELMRYIEESAHKAEGYIALAFSVFFFALVWIGGSIIFWACELGDASWSYPESLYFTYTSITTIGYGDFFPTTSATRPFFVIWSLVAVPSVTVLISNMGETVVREVENAVEWVGRRSLLPEREVIIDEEKKEKEGIKTPKSLALTLPRPKLRRRRSEPPSRRRVRTIESTQTKSLSIRLSKEITRVAKDVSMKPLLRYSWHEWVGWLRMMDEAGVVLGIGGDGFQIDGNDHQDIRRKTAVEIWKWTWLDDNGPLFSSETETQWVLDRLCRLFERVVERDALSEGGQDVQNREAEREVRQRGEIEAREVEVEGEGEKLG